MTEIIMQAYRVLDEIIDTGKIDKLKTLNASLETLYPDAFNAFIDAKNKYEQVLNEGGKYHPDYKKTIETLSQSKKYLYEQERVKKYLALENEIEQDLNMLLNDVSKAISSHVPAPNRFGMIKKGGSCHVH